MPYTPTTWVDRAVQYPSRYTKSGETTTEVTLISSPGTVTAAGTAVNATNLNKMEAGIVSAHTDIASLSTTVNSVSQSISSNNQDINNINVLIWMGGL